jgi:hypothetical protein
MSSKREEQKALEELSKEELIGLVRRLPEEVERLKQYVKQTSQTSSKPASSDILTRSEGKAGKDSEGEDSKREGKRPGRKVKTRQGFGQVDRYERIEPVECEECGSREFESNGATTRRYQVAELVGRPIEMVERASATALLRMWTASNRETASECNTRARSIGKAARDAGEIYLLKAIANTVSRVF